jgi:hypothetical protein
MTNLLGQLRAWRRREAAAVTAWAAARWLAVVGAALLAACLTDLAIDRRRDTPFAVRAGLTATQLVLAAVAAAWLWRRTRWPSLDALAGRAEAARPAFGHRLVTAVQLTRPTARTDGMSKQLIGVVATEAEALAVKYPLAGLADRRPLRLAAVVAGPTLAIASLLILIAPQTALALIARQTLLPVDIPRAVRLTADTPPVWAAGDPVTVRVLAAGDVAGRMTGTLWVQPDDQPAERHPLGFAETLADGTAVFTATLPPMGDPFAFTARVGDGRLTAPGRVTFEPRPTVEQLTAVSVSPAWLDPAGTIFRRDHPDGEVQTLPFYTVEVACGFGKPVREATVVVFARSADGREQVAARHPLPLDAARTAGTVGFLPPARCTAYRVEATDDLGFGLAAPPRRGLSVAADTPPAVTLLPEVLRDPKEGGPAEDFDVGGMPLRLGGQVQVGYSAKSPLGLGRAAAVYRVNRGAWTPLPLADTVADPAKVGPFVPSLGVFRESGAFGQVEFYRLPAAGPDQPGGLEAGGRINFQTAALTKTVEGKPVPLAVGDTVEVRVAVADRHPGPHAAFTAPPEPPKPADPRRSLGWSPAVVKTVVGDAEFEAWRKQHEAYRSRLQQLEGKQRDVFPGRPAGR